MCGASSDSFIPASNDPTVFVSKGSYVNPEYTKYVAEAAGIPNTAADRKVNNKLIINKEAKQSKAQKMEAPVTPSTGGGIQRINNRKVGGSRATPKIGASPLNVPNRKLGGL